MFSSTSSLDLTYSVPSGAPVKIVGTGKDTRLVFKNADDGFSKDNLKSAFSGDTITFDLTVSRSGNGSFHAAETVTRTIKLKKPTKNLFFEERKSDARYDGLKNAALTRIAAKRGISGEKALALFNSDNYDSMAMAYQPARTRFGGDSPGNDSSGGKTCSVKANDNKEYLSFTRYNSDYETSMGVQYIVEKVQTAEHGLLPASNRSGLQWTWAEAWSVWSIAPLLPLLQVPPELIRVRVKAR